MDSERAWPQKPAVWLSSADAPRAGRSSRRSPVSLRAIAVTASKQSTGAPTDSRFRGANRLADKSSYSRVFSQANRSRDRLFTVLFRANNTGRARLGLAIGKKNCRLSTGRNRLKRIIRESFRQRKTDLVGIDIIVLNQPAAASASNRALFDSLDNHWQRCRAKNASKSG